MATGAYTTTESLLYSLRRDGYFLFHYGVGASLEELAGSLGMPIASALGRTLVDVLTPRTREESPPGTLSNLVGAGAFPFHTETAHWRTPVDTVILRCVDPGAGNRPTLLADGRTLCETSIERMQIARTLMFVRNGHKSFLTHLAELEDGQVSFRYDPGCMRPTSAEDRISVEAFETGLSDIAPIEVAWKTGQCLVFDNRRMLHSRSASRIPDPDRRLERIYLCKGETEPR